MLSHLYRVGGVLRKLDPLNVRLRKLDRLGAWESRACLTCLFTDRALWAVRDSFTDLGCGPGKFWAKDACSGPEGEFVFGFQNWLRIHRANPRRVFFPICAFVVRWRRQAMWMKGWRVMTLDGGFFGSVSVSGSNFEGLGLFFLSFRT
jgi:hypothetical protein